MTIDEFMHRMYPQDKANHYMRGSAVASSSASLFMVVCAIAYHVHPLPLALLMWVLLAAAIVGWWAAFWAGRLKERLDAQANEEAEERGDPPPHGVETADWQYTHWGALPVVVPMVVAQLLVWAATH